MPNDTEWTPAEEPPTEEEEWDADAEEMARYWREIEMITLEGP